MHFLRALRFARRFGTNSFPDSARPDLFYHLLQPPTPHSTSHPSYALSFLPTYPTAVSDTIIGWLPALTSEKMSQAQLNHFEENRMPVVPHSRSFVNFIIANFRVILHRAIRDALRKDLDDIWRNSAIQTQHGWMHIHGSSQPLPPGHSNHKFQTDSRNMPPLGRIGDVDDIIATVLVENSKILPETYQPMPSYRLCTSDGLVQLTPGLMRSLHAFLVHSDIEEKSHKS